MADTPPARRSTPARARRRSLACAAALLLAAGACSDDGESGSGGEGGAEGGGDCGAVTLGYSAWPGWFPWAVAEDAGLFEANGVEVELKFFDDYLGSLDAMVAGELDANSQTLNDTMLGVATGSEQVIVITNDNSTGNDAIIVDESIQTIEDLRGKTVAAEAGVVDHFLLLQGLADAGMTEDDIEFTGMLTDAAAAAFAAGEVDAAGVFAPFTLQALEREGSHVLFDSSDYPGSISDHLVVTPDLIESCPATVQGLVDAWYATVDHMAANPDESVAVMAELAGISPEEYEGLAAGTTIFSAEEALAAFAEGDDMTSLQYAAEQINPFLVDAGLIPEPAPLDGLFDPSFTQAHVDGASEE